MNDKELETLQNMMEYVFGYNCKIVNEELGIRISFYLIIDGEKHLKDSHLFAFSSTSFEMLREKTIFYEHLLGRIAFSKMKIYNNYLTPSDEPFPVSYGNPSGFAFQCHFLFVFFGLTKAVCRPGNFHGDYVLCLEFETEYKNMAKAHHKYNFGEDFYFFAQSNPTNNKFNSFLNTIIARIISLRIKQFFLANLILNTGGPYLIEKRQEGEDNV